MKFTTNRDITVSSTCGRSVEFKKDVPVHVPPAMYGEVQAVGAVPEEAIVVEESKSPVEPTCPIQRKALVEKAYDKLIEDGEREAFTAAGSPTIEVIQALSGIKLTAPERDTSWDTYRQEKAAAEAEAEAEAGNDDDDK